MNPDIGEEVKNVTNDYINSLAKMSSVKSLLFLKAKIRSEY